MPNIMPNFIDRIFANSPEDVERDAAGNIVAIKGTIPADLFGGWTVAKQSDSAREELNGMVRNPSVSPDCRRGG